MVLRFMKSTNVSNYASIRWNADLYAYPGRVCFLPEGLKIDTAIE